MVSERPASRLDKALAEVAPEASGLSRSRLQVLLEAGAVTRAGGGIAGAKDRPHPGEAFLVAVPEALDPVARAEDIALKIVFEDAHLAVIDKPAGMVVHPAPGAASGTLVNALLHHFGGALSGINGEKRPGIVHRIDKDTSGLLVVAKSDAAHQGLARQFTAHSAERSYLAVMRGRPDSGSARLGNVGGVSFEPGGVIRIEGNIGRHPSDRKKMAVLSGSGRRAVTRLRVLESYGPQARPWASLVECRLETGRTHQIRVHAAHIGHALAGDPVYAAGKAAFPASAPEQLRRFARQALHAASLGFVHPLSGEPLAFRSDLPADLAALVAALRASGKSDGG